MLLVRKTLTEILLEVTDEKIQEISSETLSKYRKKGICAIDHNLPNKSNHKKLCKSPTSGNKSIKKEKKLKLSRSETKIWCKKNCEKNVILDASRDRRKSTKNCYFFIN